MSRRVQQAAAYIEEKHVHKEREKKYALFDFGKNVSTQLFLVRV
jgi:hypothetical protein